MNSVPAIRTVLAHAYDADPVLGWIFPDSAARPDATAAWLGLFAEWYDRAHQLDSVEDNGGLAAVVLWKLPGEMGPAPGLPTIAGLLDAFLGHARAAAIGEALHAVADIQPTVPHVYVNFLAVEPPRQGRGLGRRLLDPVLSAATQAGVGVHLESANPRAVRFFERAGFVVSGQLQLSAGGPLLRAMWRN